jgi:Kef-type K+ transport system membrane component KefB
LQVFIELLVLLLLARLLGAGANRLGLSAAVGKLGSGIVLAAAIAVLAPSFPSVREFASREIVGFVVNAGIFLLVLMAGMEMHPARLTNRSKGAAAGVLGSLNVPLAGVWCWRGSSCLK